MTPSTNNFDAVRPSRIWCVLVMAIAVTLILLSFAFMSAAKEQPSRNKPMASALVVIVPPVQPTITLRWNNTNSPVMFFAMADMNFGTPFVCYQFPAGVNSVTLPATNRSMFFTSAKT